MANKWSAAVARNNAMNRLLRPLILALAGMAVSLTAHAEIQASAFSCSYELRTGTSVASCPSVTKISPELLPNEVVSSESSGRFLLAATPSDPSQADFSLSAVSRARADYGTLGIYASVTSTGSSNGGGHAGIAETNAWATFSDTLTITSTLLPLGSPVTFRYDHSLQRSVSYPPSVELGGGEAASLESLLQINFVRNGFSFLIPPVDLHWCAGVCDNSNVPGYTQIAPDGIETFSGQVQLQVGDVINVWSTLRTSSRVVWAGSEGFGSHAAEVRSFDSAHPYFRIEGQDAFLVAASGHDYTMPVPEPSTWAMLACGLGLLFGSRRVSARAASEA